jgi:hypothetical protein
MWSLCSLLTFVHAKAARSTNMLMATERRGGCNFVAPIFHHSFVRQRKSASVMDEDTVFTATVWKYGRLCFQEQIDGAVS